jgi:hypothetical protein
MIFSNKYKVKVLIFASLSFLFHPGSLMSQEDPKRITAFEDYAEEVIDPDDDFLVNVEEWRNVIDQWLEKPLCINNEEADWLMDYKIISLYQLNKLKEYRLVYSNLLSVYELAFIDGWDFQTIRKVIPLVTVNLPKKNRTFKKFTYRSIRQSLIFKTAFNTQKSKGYEPDMTDDNVTGDPIYTGPPARMSLRYDIEYREKLALGLRMEKDPGEPFLVSSGSLLKNFKTPDLLSGFLHIKQLGPVESIILGNYRVSFGYGINLAGGQSGITGRSGMPGMACRIRPQTSVSETGFFSGAALSAGFARFSLAGFASMQKVDGSSVITDSISGDPISFSSIIKSGLHRTISELDKRKAITEKVFGGYLVYRNDWLKTGLIAIYNQFDASMAKSSRPYAKFGLSGKENLVLGGSATIWLPGFQLFTEASISRNKGMAVLSGLQLMPVPGTLVYVIYRHFATDYQNLYGSGFISASRNSDENGIRAGIRLELPKKWLVEFINDNSRSQWPSYNLDAPSTQKELRVSVEKAWLQNRSLIFSFRYLNETAANPENSVWITHPVSLSQYRLRMEGRVEMTEGMRLKSRVECNLVQGLHPGWLIFQDIEFATKWLKAKFWLRACFFDVMEYDSRIYAYENDVLYDFTSFMHYGKGVRGILMSKFSPADWLDLWIRLSTIYYTNKYIGSGWDEVEGNRQNEIEVQVRIKLPG